MAIISPDDPRIIEIVTSAADVVRPRGNPGGSRNAPKYIDLVTAFDIETTRLEEIEQSVMWIWQMALAPDLCIVGRTWDEFIDMISRIREAVGNRVLVCYVHNLSYEFQFLAGVMEFKTKDVFAIKSRKVLKARFGPIEFRCSYLHSNMSLEKYLESMRVEHKKLTMDYTVRRYPWSSVSAADLAYCVNDVCGLVEAIRREMELDDDTLLTIPLTSTGYVRRDAKRVMHHSRQHIQTIIPDYDTFVMLRQAFRGGNTHANRHYAGYILEDVKSYDRSSSYPDVLVNCKFPMSPWYDHGYQRPDQVAELLSSGKALLMRIALAHVQLRDDMEPCPYLPRDKCQKCINAACDNGRVLSADYVEIVVTDIDWRIINRQYVADSYVFMDIRSSRYGYLPRGLRDLNIEYYRAKTGLKGDPDSEYFYMKSKNKLNSIYGMTAQNPLRDLIEYQAANVENNGGFVESPAGQEEYDKLHNRMWTSYAFGVWVTAWARWRLQQGIDLAGYGFVYADTDSVKYIGDIDWTDYNQRRKRDSLESGAYADDRRGVRHYMGIYEAEDPYKRFRTWGAKKYAYEDPAGNLHVTVSGVSKKLGGQELAAAGGLEAFAPGFVFRLAGGVELRYNDIVNKVLNIDGHDLRISRNVVIRDSTYALGITSEYQDLIKYFSIGGIELKL